MLIFSLKPAVCVSQLLNTWVTSSTDALIRQKKRLRLAPPLNCDLLKNPPPLLSGSLIWTLFKPSFIQKKLTEHRSLFSISVLIDIHVFLRVHTWGPPGKTTGVCCRLVINSPGGVGGAALLNRTWAAWFGGDVSHSHFSAFPAFPSWSTVGANNFSRQEAVCVKAAAAHFPLFVCVCVCLTAAPQPNRLARMK